MRLQPRQTGCLVELRQAAPTASSLTTFVMPSSRGFTARPHVVMWA